MLYVKAQQQVAELHQVTHVVEVAAAPTQLVDIQSESVHVLVH